MNSSMHMVTLPLHVSRPETESSRRREYRRYYTKALLQIVTEDGADIRGFFCIKQVKEISRTDGWYTCY